MKAKNKKRPSMGGLVQQIETTHPGKALEETLDHLQVTVPEAAQSLGLMADELHEIIRGKAPISDALADKLDQKNIANAKFWKNSQADYVADCKRLNLWDVFIFHYETRKIASVAGTALKTEGSFHTVEKRIETALSRINDAYGVMAVRAGLFGKGDILPEGIEQYDGE